jgi:soluble lytic murein transglycosylase-like protein
VVGTSDTGHTGARRALALVALTVLWLSAASRSSAQIYSWHDDNGHLVLSDRPLGPVERLYSVPKAVSVRATRGASIERSRLYDDLIGQQARLNGVRTDLVRAVVQVESGFNPYARSRRGALGLMQLMPATARQFGVGDPFDAADNIRAGVAYLRQLLDRYHDDEQLALAAYNAGPARVEEHGESVPPYRETRDYVARVGELAAPSAATSSVIYKTIEVVDGRAVARYSDRKPARGPYEIIAGR